MRASPRTWPSIRFSRRNEVALACSLMSAIYPYRVLVSIDQMAHDHHRHSPHEHRHDHTAAVPGAALDPVCGMAVDPQTAKHRHRHENHTYYFCSVGCRTKFAAAPAKYLD